MILRTPLLGKGDGEGIPAIRRRWLATLGNPPDAHGFNCIDSVDLIESIESIAAAFTTAA